jgi:hypothetical protein
VYEFTFKPQYVQPSKVGKTNPSNHQIIADEVNGGLTRWQTVAPANAPPEYTLVDAPPSSD